MTKTTITLVDQIYKKNAGYNYKTVEQLQKDFEPELKAISELFQINTEESLFLIAIIIINTEYKNWQLDDIAMVLEISKFEVIKNVEVLYLLQAKGLIEIKETDDSEVKNKNFLSGKKYPINVLNKHFVISKIVEEKLLNI